MANSSYGQKGESDHLFVIVVGFLVVVVGLWFFWDMFHTELVYGSMWLDWHVLSGLAWLWSPSWLSTIRQELAYGASVASLLTPLQLWKLLSRAGLVMTPLLLILLGLLARTMRKHPSNRVRRAITPENLRWIMAKHAPAIIPTLYYPNLLKHDPPEHRSMDAPEEWVLRHKLVINDRLDRQRTHALLVEQLGARLGSVFDLAPHERSLFAVFGARLFSDGLELAMSQALLDKLNYSCHQGQHNGKRGFPDLTITESSFQKYAAHPEVGQWVATHGYSRTLLHAMHLEAIKKGKVPSAHFIWLKAMDRQLWAALNTTGRKTPFVESLAVFSQTRWESYVGDLGYRIADPHLGDAVDALEVYLQKVGLVNSLSKGKR
jgi:intracellular multiplication protein IcmP